MVDMPDVSSQYALVMIAQASRATQDKSTTDRTIGICHLIENPPVPPETAVNVISPLGSISDYFQNSERLALGLRGKVSVLEGPKHGQLRGPLSGDSLYVPTPDYHGPDRATLLVEIGGRIVRAIYFFNVMQSVPGGTE